MHGEFEIPALKIPLLLSCVPVELVVPRRNEDEEVAVTVPVFVKTAPLPG